MATMPGLLILDFDGTLADTFEDVANAMIGTFKAQGHRPPARESIHRHMGLRLEAAIPLMGGPSEPEKLQTWVAAYRRRYLEDGGRRTKLFPGTREVLKGAADNGLQPVLVSNKGIDAIRSCLRRTEIDGYLAAVFAADTGLHHKPDGRLYRSEIKARFPEIGDEDSVVVGDTATDLLFARNSGLRSCWATYGYGNATECRQMSPDFSVNRFDQLPELLSWAGATR